MEFCKAFNARTESIEKGLPIPVVITVYADRSFTFITKTPPAAVLLKKLRVSNLVLVNRTKIKWVKVTLDQVRQIAETKAADMTGATIETKMKSIAEFARSMGLVVEE